MTVFLCANSTHSTRTDAGFPEASGMSLNLECTEPEIGIPVSLPTDKANVEWGSRNKVRRKSFLEEGALVLDLEIGVGVHQEAEARRRCQWLIIPQPVFEEHGYITKTLHNYLTGSCFFCPSPPSYHFLCCLYTRRQASSNGAGDRQTPDARC